MDALIDLVIVLFVVGLILYVVSLVPIDATIKQIIRVIVIVFVCIWLLQMLRGGYYSPRGGYIDCNPHTTIIRP